MPRFFVPAPLRAGETVSLSEADARHVAGALRMAAGDSLTLCDGAGTDYRCVILSARGTEVSVTVEEATPCRTEPTLAVTLYMGMPKADKLEWVIQKAVELGVTAVVPVITRRSILRLSGADAEKKTVRWQKIAAEAAGQSERGIVPAVELPLSWKQALTRWQNENTILCYERGGVPLGTMVSPQDRAVSLIVGPEGGFAPEEVDAVTAAGGRIATLGPRILRCETAPIAALTVLMERSGNLS